MKKNEKFSLIFWIFVLIMMSMGLFGCSKTEPSTAIIDNIKQDVKVIEKQVETVKESLPAQCKTPVITGQLDNIQEAIKTISAKAESVGGACELKDKLYEEKISKLHIIIGVLFAIGCVLGFLLTKKRLLV